MSFWTTRGLLLMVSIIATVAISMSLFRKPLTDCFVHDATVMTTKKHNIDCVQEREPWITVFVHGSFGSLLGFLNVFQVAQDDVEGTTYKKVVGRLRKDPFFYQDQPLLKKGLIPIEPTFDLAVTGSKKLAAYPLLKAYDLMSEYVKPGKEKNYFYTFGWSGLISQRRRRLEAIRFYNALSVELERYRKNGKSPKIRIITHSHGGNIVAYLAAIDEVLAQIDAGDFSYEKGDERGEALAKIKKRIDELPSGEKYAAKGEKKWDYKPEKRSFSVDELVLWGMPVQPETDRLFASQFFKEIYHFYSDEDLVQRLDWVSTKQGYSDRRFNKKRLAQGEQKNSLPNKFVQARITVGRQLEKQESTNETIGIKQEDPEEKKEESFWSVLFSGGSILHASTKDPTHKELWFFSWQKETSDENRPFILAPFPVMIFTPVLTELSHACSEHHDLDFNITQSQEEVAFELVKHNDLLLQKEFFVRQSFLQELEKQVQPWQAAEVSSQDVFNIIRKYTDYS